MSMKSRFRKIINEISARYKFVSGAKGAIEKPYQQLKQSRPDGTWGKIGRVAGLGTIDLSWLLFCLAKYTAKDLNTIFLDNQIIDKLKEQKQKIEIKNGDSTVRQIFKSLQQSHPKTAARLHLWMLYTLIAGMTIGGVKISQNRNSNNNKVATEQTLEQTPEQIPEQTVESPKKTSKTLGDYKDLLRPITPWLVAQLISAEGVHMENGMHTPYQDSNGIWTIGFGSTRLKNGKPVTPDTKPITTEEAYELARWHLEDRETFFVLSCYGAANEDLLPKNTGEAFGLASIMYNSASSFIEDEKDYNHRERFELLRQEYKKNGENISDSTIIDLFNRYPIRSKTAFGRAWIDSNNPQDMADAIGLYMRGGKGMHWRRWLEAGLITGDILPEELLECPVGGLYDFYLYMGAWKTKGVNAKYVLWDKTPTGVTPKKETYQMFREWLANPKTKQKGTGIEGTISRPKVKDFLPVEVLEKCMHSECEIGYFQEDNNKSKVLAFNIGINNIKHMPQQYDKIEQIKDNSIMA